MIIKIGVTLGLLALTALLLYATAYMFSTPGALLAAIRWGLVALLAAGVALTWFGPGSSPWLIGALVVGLGLAAAFLFGLIGG